MKREIPNELKRASLEKVLESHTFARAEQMRRLLHWLVDRAMEDGTPPSEYEVGRDALHRPESFDPQTDSLVRKEMNRLRAKLKLYYSSEGNCDSVCIRSGDGYRMAFDWAHPVAASNGQTNGHGSLLVPPLNAGDGCTETAEAFYEELLLHIASSGKLHLISQTTARMYGQSFGDVRDFAAKTGAEYVMEGTLRTKGDAAQVTIWLVNGATGIAQQLSRLAGNDVGHLAGQVAQLLVSRIQPAN